MDNKQVADWLSELPWSIGDLNRIFFLAWPVHNKLCQSKYREAPSTISIYGFSLAKIIQRLMLDLPISLLEIFYALNRNLIH